MSGEPSLVPTTAARARPMEDVVSAIRKAEEAVRELPKELRPVAFRYVLDRLGVNGEAVSVPRPQGPREGKAGGRPGRKHHSDVKINVPRLKEFAAPKAPQNHEERVAVIAAFLEQEGFTRIDDEPLRRAYRAMRWKLPGNMRQIMCNVHCRKGWMSEAGPDRCRELTEIGRHFVEGMRRT